MGNFRGWEWILILLLALLLFGGFKKLPDAARGIGRSLRIFKAETRGLADGDEPHSEAESAAAKELSDTHASAPSTPKETVATPASDDGQQAKN